MKFVNKDFEDFCNLIKQYDVTEYKKYDIFYPFRMSFLLTSYVTEESYARLREKNYYQRVILQGLSDSLRDAKLDEETLYGIVDFINMSKFPLTSSSFPDEPYNKHSYYKINFLNLVKYLFVLNDDKEEYASQYITYIIKYCLNEFNHAIISNKKVNLKPELFNISGIFDIAKFNNEFTAECMYLSETSRQYIIWFNMASFINLDKINLDNRKKVGKYLSRYAGDDTLLNNTMFHSVPLSILKHMENDTDSVAKLVQYLKNCKVNKIKDLNEEQMILLRMMV